jgi:hypothetical protein
MTTVEIEKHKILLNQEADQKIKVIHSEYDSLYHAVKSSKTIEFEKLTSKQSLLSEVRSLRDSIKQKKRDVIEVQDKISSEEFYRVSKQSTLNALRRKI